MPEKDNRRYADKRMDGMEEDIREIRAEQKSIASDVAAIREKIFNGFDRTVQETHREVRELRDIKGKVDTLVDQNTPESKLATCPLKDDMMKKLERKVYVVVGLMTIALTLVTFASNLFVG